MFGGHNGNGKTGEALDCSTAAEYLNVSKFTLYRWLSEGRLQRSKAGGRTLVRESELTKLIEDGAPARKIRRAAKV
jgi:excisionase family DNA binding protein